MSFWFDADSDMVVIHCGENTVDALPHALPFSPRKDNKLGTALDKTDAAWVHEMNHVHWILFDLGRSHYITSIRGLLNGTTNIDQMNVFVGDDPDALGDSVLDILDFQNYTPTDVYRYDLSKPKLGRYVRIIIGHTTHPFNYLRWG